MSELITKQEYEAKATELAKQMIEFAMLTKEFNQTGCYAEEFIKVGEKELTLAVMDENWVLISKDTWNELISYRGVYDQYKNNLEKETKPKKYTFGIGIDGKFVEFGKVEV